MYRDALDCTGKQRACKNIMIEKKAINLNRYLYNENAILPLKDPTMSNHPLKLWTEGFPNVALYNHLFKSCSYFILHIVFELFANVRKNQPLWLQRGTMSLSKMEKQAVVESFQPYHKGFYTTATIDRAPFSKGCLRSFPPRCKTETEPTVKDALTHKHKPQGTRARLLPQRSPIVRMTFAHLRFCSNLLVFFQQITCVSGLSVKSSESSSIR